ncbi:hypothetical protein B0I72DRAFT_137515 [Yarrowia lipolytica]|jgi:hypothetical protein|uniref:YALI0B09757p n=2 Tax=Yarrowia lipolytica TaxID=4952 RepID=Q6CF70_YARLI|nr:YALI0B09757p [Yarrowia lipolytica CLIB122]AOW01475.1 hypothetical protein YALI1_B13122g [Yarrowia lipolytica]KAB8280367.1 hypothetical protein BKA91DRAFT_142050 [Yarrowia lipolytica]KAE8169413.1 hypothetical protein BKA90DRAFT_142690 [Yarrowia lipolytica]KAJ8052294.1 hypothetical protein LXG23DRAFT_38357 [Yarrowia lipolytica]QNP97236.1 Hypothetical protein YALI2_C00889g [Yarrowia lipolytica]|eukprot:XP_500692.2 YALI0B09757p [Yarrowia lipolytica CLIB122]
MSQTTSVTRLARLVAGKTTGDRRDIFRDSVRVFGVVQSHEFDTLRLKEVPELHALMKAQKLRQGIEDKRPEAVVTLSMAKSGLHEHLMEGTMIMVYIVIPRHMVVDNEEDYGLPPSYVNIDVVAVNVLSQMGISPQQADVMLKLVRQEALRLGQES